MARKLDPYRETARIALEPWLVEAALARLPEPLSPADQRTILRPRVRLAKFDGQNGGANIRSLKCALHSPTDFPNQSQRQVSGRDPITC